MPHLPLMLCEICKGGDCIMFVFSTLAPSTIPALEESLCLFLLWELQGIELQISGIFLPKGGFTGKVLSL